MLIIWCRTYFITPIHHQSHSTSHFTLFDSSGSPLYSIKEFQLQRQVSQRIRMPYILILYILFICFLLWFSFGKKNSCGVGSLGEPGYVGLAETFYLVSNDVNGVQMGILRLMPMGRKADRYATGLSMGPCLGLNCANIRKGSSAVSSFVRVPLLNSISW